MIETYGTLVKSGSDADLSDLTRLYVEIMEESLVLQTFLVGHAGPRGSSHFAGTYHALTTPALGQKAINCL